LESIMKARALLLFVAAVAVAAGPGRVAAQESG
jgi:hypothetical protein